MARPVHTPDPALRRQVEAMAGYGIPELGIARVIGIDPKTLRKHYRSELDLGHVKANSAVAQSLFKKATGDGPQSVTAAIFWAKTRMGWKETIVNEHGGVENNPVRISVVRRIIVDPAERETPRAIPHFPSKPD
ncbi:hypothetical protein [Mesorhizobium sp. KR9-304]|uniref:hypothetical protein n=1 Tax=Mesorhizobium sp. KR9-304 TaxID=3156614 RepID=UPI0032B50115